MTATLPATTDHPSLTGPTADPHCFVAIGTLGARYCYRCGGFTAHHVVRSTGHSRGAKMDRGYLTQCMRCSTAVLSSGRDLVDAGISADEARPDRPSRSWPISAAIGLLVLTQAVALGAIALLSS